jgi:hypothetical protein
VVELRPALVPALVLGLMTTAGMWQLTSLVLVAQCSPLTSWPSSPSSQVTKMAAWPPRPCFLTGLVGNLVGRLYRGGGWKRLRIRPS